MTKFKALMIDLDNCLYPYFPCNEAGMNAVYDILMEKINKPRSELEKLFLESRKKVKSTIINNGSSHSRLLYFQILTENIFGKTNLFLALELNDIFWKNYLSNINLYEGVLEFFEFIKSKNVKIVIVTDLTVAIQIRKLIFLNLDKYIDFLVTSEESGVDKPNSKIFEIALSKLGVNKEETIMFGDSLEKDVKGAESFGIKAILTNKNTFEDEKIREYFG